MLHSIDAMWSSELSFLDNYEYHCWLKRFRSVSEIALRAQLFSRQDKKNVELWSDAFKQVNDEALRMMATSLRERLGSDELLNAIKLLSSLVIYIRGERSRLSSIGRTFLESNFIKVGEVQQSGHFLMIDNPLALKNFINISYN